MPGLKIGFIPIEGGRYYEESLEEVTRAEELGFHSVWMEEHHAVTDHYWPSPLTVLAGYATRTTTMTLGTDIVVAAFHHPVRLAEDVAMLDVMSNGRVVLGIAIGYKPDEFALYGVDLEKRGARFEEQLAIMKGLWTQETVSFKGRYYTVDGRIEPKPVTKPHPPLWIGGWGDITLRRAATLATTGFPARPRTSRGCSPARSSFSPTAPPRARRPDHRVAAHARRHHRRHRPQGARARRTAHHDQLPEGVRGRLEAPRSSTRASPPISTSSWKTASSSAAPIRWCRRSKNSSRKYGMTHLICRTFFPGMPHAHIMRELELLAKEVIPALS
jgi:alkanesulfonate monooxygenase SsuD/methylene tetrahydromethanopterin reductase-like flavin-dependent oxidoreductase (luciferase family)